MKSAKQNKQGDSIAAWICLFRAAKQTPRAIFIPTCFVWRNKHAGGVLLGVCFARPNKQARIPRVLLIYLHKHSQYPAYANANAHGDILFPLPFGPKRALPIKKVAYVLCYYTALLYITCAYQLSGKCALRRAQQCKCIFELKNFLVQSPVKATR